MPFIVFLFGVICTVFFFGEAHKNAINFSKAYFERNASLRTNIVSGEFRKILREFDSIRRFFEGSQFVSRKEFEDFTKPFFVSSRSIQKVLWIPRIEQAQRSSFEDLWKKEHGSYAIHDLTPEGRAPVAPSRDSHYPITLLAPFDQQDDRFLGLDLGTDLFMKNIFNASFLSEQGSSTFPSPWFLGVTKEDPYLLISPVTTGKNEDISLIHSAINGYLAMIFSPVASAQKALEYPLTPGTHFILYDISFSPEALLLDLPPEPRFKTRETFRFLYPQSAVYKEEISLPGRKFLIEIRASSEFFMTFFSPVYWGILPLGIFLSIVIAFYIRRSACQRAMAQRFADEQTRELQEKEQHLLTTLQSIGDALITTDAKGHVTRINSVAERLTGWTAADAVGRPLKEIFHILNEETRQLLVDPVEKVLQEGQIVSLANHTILVSRDGQERPIDDSGAPIVDSAGHIIGVVLVFRDVTESRAATRALESSEKKFRAFFTHMYEGAAMHRLIYGRNGVPVNYILTDVNPRFEEILGISREQAVGKLATDIFGTLHPPFLDEYVHCIESGEPVNFTAYFEPLNKYFMISVISYSQGTFATVFMDVTASHKAAEDLKEREAYLRAILDNFPHLTWLKDPQGRFLAVNQFFATACGKGDPESLRGLTDFDIWPPELAERYVADDQEVMKVRSKKFLEEPVLEQGVLKWFETYKTPIIDEAGRILGTTGFGRDITDRKMNQDLIKQGIERLERASEAGKVALWERNLQANSIEWSGFIYSLLGIPEKDMGNTIQEWEARIHTDDLSGVRKLFEEHIRNNVPYDAIYRVKKGDGSYLWVHDIGKIQKNEEGNILRMSGVCVDITKQREAEDELQRLATVIRYSSELVSLASFDGQIIFLNEAGAEILGIDPQEVQKKKIFDVVPEALLPKLKEEILPALLQEGEWEGELQYRNLKTGSLTDVQALLFTVIDPRSKQPLYLANISLDITKRKLTEQTLAQERELLRILVDNIPDSIYVKDISGRKILANRADLDFMGVKEEKDVLGKTDADFYPPHLAEQYIKDDQQVLQHGHAVINREELIDGTSGGFHCLLTSKIPVRGPDGNITGLIGIGRDITDRKHLENKLLTLAHYDTLTSLPNRTLFLEKAGSELAKARRSGTMCALLFVDLDLFKSVNDTMGHSVGDELLRDTAIKLTECIRESDTIARLGGDEFIIFLNELEDGQAAQQIAERIREKFNCPRIIAGNDLFITASIGIAIFPHDGDTFEELLKNADTAMYAAKETGRNNFCFFNNIMNQKAVTKMQVERGLRDALLKEEFVLYYQPIISAADGKIMGFEALLRWFRKEGGLIFPDEFIPVAEETGLILPIGEWVLRRTCQFNKILTEEGFSGLSIAVNISVTQLRRSGIVDTILSALAESEMPPESLEVEVTESLLIESFETAVDILRQLRSIGIKVSLDDFGTGYSSLSHLQHLPISRLKIDRLFLNNLSGKNADSDLTPAIIDLAHKLKLTVVAEGVEQESQFQKLKENQCDYLQGYLISKPLPEEDVFTFLRNHYQRLKN